jgi:prolyl 4-hydroxylase
MYLNDVEEGGGTHFGPLNLTVQPKKGRVVIWPSVLDEDPLEMDERTHHEALPVKAGIKYGANAWLHLRDFKTQSEKGCI